MSAFQPQVLEVVSTGYAGWNMQYQIRIPVMLQDDRVVWDEPKITLNDVSERKGGELTYAELSTLQKRAGSLRMMLQKTNPHVWWKGGDDVE
jgi:hypothetical protein